MRLTQISTTSSTSEFDSFRTPFFYDSAIAQGYQVCVLHKGLHEWVWLDARDGFCLGLPLSELLNQHKNNHFKNIGLQ